MTMYPSHFHPYLLVGGCGRRCTSDACPFFPCVTRPFLPCAPAPSSPPLHVTNSPPGVARTDSPPAGGPPLLQRRQLVERRELSTQPMRPRLLYTH
jgi:hypothetical protein